MERKNQHYSTRFPDVNLKIHTVAESLRRHLYLFKTTTGVFSFKKIDLGTKVLIEHMIIPKEQSILLDLGCGYGPIGMVLGFESPLSRVYFIDVNKRAIWCCKENIKINLIDYKKRTKVLSGNYLEPIKRKNLKFNGIYMNPPLRQGRKDFLQVLNEIPRFLKPNGFFQFVIKKKMGASYVLKRAKNIFHEEAVEITCKRSGYWVFFCVVH